VLRGGDAGVGKEGDDAALEGAEAAFDFVFCLRGRRDEVGHAKPAQGALEFALWIAAIATGAGAEEAERIGVDGLGNAVDFKGGAEVAEVIPSGVGGAEVAGDIEPGMIIHGEQEDLLLRSRPPLRWQLADPRAAKAAVACWRRSGAGSKCGRCILR